MRWYSDTADRAAIRAIEQIETRGCTNLHEGWMAGAEQVALHKEAHPEGIHRLLILTDGQANNGLIPKSYPRYGQPAACAASARRRWALVYSTEQIEPIAEHGGGRSHVLH